MILETSETMRVMAEIYDIPQLAFLVRRIVLTISVLLTIWNAIWANHTANRTFDIQKCLQAIIPNNPTETNYIFVVRIWIIFLMTIAVSYGAVGLKMPIQDVNIVSEKQENGVWLWMIP